MICSKKSSSQRKQVYKYPSIPNHMVNEPKIQQIERALTDNSIQGDNIAIDPSVTWLHGRSAKKPARGRISTSFSADSGLGKS